MPSRGARQRPALPDGPAGVGPRITALRVERGLSLSELARRAAVGKATLSGLESGSRNPTLDTLHAIAAALGVPITAVVAASGQPSRVQGAAVDVRMLRVFDDGRFIVELCHLHVPAGAAQESPAHHRGVTEHVTVFSGVLLAGPAGAPLRAGPGEYIEWAADVRHAYSATPEGDVLASLVIRSPRRGELPNPGLLPPDTLTR